MFDETDGFYEGSKKVYWRACLGVSGIKWHIVKLGFVHFVYNSTCIGKVARYRIGINLLGIKQLCIHTTRAEWRI